MKNKDAVCKYSTYTAAAAILMAVDANVRQVSHLATSVDAELESEAKAVSTSIEIIVAKLMVKGDAAEKVLLGEVDQ